MMAFKLFRKSKRSQRNPYPSSAQQILQMNAVIAWIKKEGESFCGMSWNKKSMWKKILKINVAK